MKKALFTLFIILTIFSSAIAQETKFGLKGGLNYAFIHGSDVLDVTPDLKFHAGFIVNIGISDVVGVQPEFVFSVKGFGGDNATLDLNYVDVPILLKVKFGDIFSVHAGPQLSYLLSSEYKSDLIEIDYEEQIQSFDLGVAAGFELELVAGLSLGARYSFSVQSIGEEYEIEKVDPNDATKTIIENVEAPDYKNGLLQVFAAYSF